MLTAYSPSVSPAFVQKRIPLSGEQWQDIEREATSSKAVDALAQKFRQAGFIICSEEEVQQLESERQLQLAEGQKLLAQSERDLALAKAGQAQALIKIEKARAMRVEAEKEGRDLITKQFCSLFKSKNPLPVEEISTIFKTYLADSSMSFEELEKENSAFFRLNSMKGVIKYLEKHQDVLACDFRVFKAEIYDIPALAEHLKKSKVTAVAIRKCISDASKASLAEAVAARNGGLKVQYFD